MIKKFFLFVIIAAAFFIGCTKNSDVSPAQSVQSSSSGLYSGYAMKGTTVGYSQSIPVDSANRMIQSYLFSINYPANDSGLRSLSFNADTLRAYLADDRIKDIKFMFAHQPAYMNSGHFGVSTGMNPAAVTLVIVGVDNIGKFVLNNRNEVFEHCAPCPFMCDAVSNDPYIHY